jgi:single-stranded DNA-specific DHH superfamily exonuclease
MVKPKFENLDIDAWIYPGKLGRSSPSVCLFHPTEHVGHEILDAVDELKIEGCPSKRKLTFRPSKRSHGIISLKLLLVSASDELLVMNIACEAAAATIQMTEMGLPLVREALSKWMNGSEDFGVSPRQSSLDERNLGQLDRASAELWFWGPGYDGP